MVRACDISYPFVYFWVLFSGLVENRKKHFFLRAETETEPIYFLLIEPERNPKRKK